MVLRRICIFALANSVVPVVAEAGFEERPEASRSFAIGSAGVFTGVDHRATTHRATTGRSDEKLHLSDFDRIDMGNAGITPMEGVPLSNSLEARAHQSHEAASRPALIRRHPAAAGGQENARAAALAGDAELIEEEVQTKKTEAARRSVSWESCENGSCRCYARRRVVIRYQREQASGSFASQVNAFTNWYYRSRQEPYVNTTMTEFSKGFTTNANNLPTCGGDAAWAKDCKVEPQACSFDTSDTNPYDAKVGEYCCSGQFEYCSYRCQGNEVFKCPSLTTDINFPGGMDPAGPDVYKRCYMAQYAHGLNPASATDADTDVGGHAD